MPKCTIETSNKDIQDALVFELDLKITERFHDGTIEVEYPHEEDLDDIVEFCDDHNVEVTF